MKLALSESNCNRVCVLHIGIIAIALCHNNVVKVVLPRVVSTVSRPVVEVSLQRTLSILLLGQ